MPARFTTVEEFKVPAEVEAAIDEEFEWAGMMNEEG